MSKATRSASQPEIVESPAQIPPGSKQVRVNRTETFIEPLSATEDIGENSEMVDADLGDEAEFIDAEPEPVEPSPFDRFLSSFQQDEDVVIYVRRRPDPPGSQFRNPHTGPVTTIGDLPYDSSLDSATALDIAIQRMYGGGHYLLEFKRGGRYAGAKTRYIADPPERPEEITKPSLAPVAAPTVGKSPIDEIRGSLEIAREFRDLLLPPSVRNAMNAIANGTMSNPSDPITEARTSMETLKELVEFAKDLTPEPAPAASGDSMLGGVAAVLRELKDYVPVVLPILMRAGANQPPQPGNGVPHQPSPVPHAQAGAMPAPQPQPEIPAMAIPLLTSIVADLAADAPVDKSVNDTMAMLETVRQLPGDLSGPALKFLNDQIMNKSPMMVGLWLASLDPQWQLLVTLQHTAHWLALYQDGLREQLETFAAPGPSAPDAESTSEMFELINDDSEPPAAVAGGPNDVSGPRERAGQTTCQDRERLATGS